MSAWEASLEAVELRRPKFGDDEEFEDDGFTFDDEEDEDEESEDGEEGGTRSSTDHEALHLEQPVV